MGCQGSTPVRVGDLEWEQAGGMAWCQQEGVKTMATPPTLKDQDLPLESIMFVPKYGGLSLVNPNKLRVKLVSFCVT